MPKRYVRRSKFNVRIDDEGKRLRTLDGITFHSVAEKNRYAELKLLERQGLIRDLALQPRYNLHCRTGQRVTWYLGDFLYKTDTETVLEDVKGRITREYLMKKKWLALEHGIKITEIKRS